MNIQEVYNKISELTPKFPCLAMISLERTLEKIQDEGLSNFRYNQIKQALETLKDFNINELPSPQKEEYGVAQKEAIDIIEKSLELFPPSNA